MRWKRGLFRLWMVVSALWVIPLTLLIASEAPLDVYAFRFLIFVVFLPPVLVLAIGMALVWAIRGFSNRDR